MDPADGLRTLPGGARCSRASGDSGTHGNSRENSLSKAVRMLSFWSIRASAREDIPSHRRLGVAWVVVALLGSTGCPWRSGRVEPGAAPSAAPLDSRIEATILRQEDRREPGPVRPLLADADPGVRARAALGLGRIGNASDVVALAALEADADAGVRGAAAFALGLIGVGGSGPFL